jgi:hypothetical protein
MLILTKIQQFFSSCLCVLRKSPFLHKIGQKSSKVVIITLTLIFLNFKSFHIACDGKLGGVVQPNDGLCHLNSSGYYTHSTKQARHTKTGNYTK